MSDICSDYIREALIGGCKMNILLNEYICDRVQCHSVQWQLKHHKGSTILQGYYISICRCSWNCVHPAAILAISYLHQTIFIVHWMKRLKVNNLNFGLLTCHMSALLHLVFRSTSQKQKLFCCSATKVRRVKI